MTDKPAVAALSLRGLVAATFTPFHPDGKVDLPRIDPLVEFLLSQSLGGLYVLGSTGEGVSLSLDERRAVAERFVGSVAGRLPVILQVGSDSLTQAAELARHAQAIGADAISAVCPVYFKAACTDALVASMAQIAAAAPLLPFYYYHVPAMTGVNHSAVDFLRQAIPSIPTLCGIKFTSYDLFEYQTCLQIAGDEREILWGRDEMLLYGLVAGAQAAVGSTYNFAAPLYQRLWAAYASGDLPAARAAQANAQDIIRTFLPFGPLAAQKAIMALIGHDCGPTRLPVVPLDARRISELQQQLENNGWNLTAGAIG